MTAVPSILLICLQHYRSAGAVALASTETAATSALRPISAPLNNNSRLLCCCGWCCTSGSTCCTSGRSDWRRWRPVVVRPEAELAELAALLAEVEMVLMP